LQKLSLPSIVVAAVTLLVAGDLHVRAQAPTELRAGQLVARFEPGKGLDLEYLGYPLLRGGDVTLHDLATRQVFLRLSAGRLDVKTVSEPRPTLTVVAQPNEASDAELLVEVRLPDNHTATITVTARQARHDQAFAAHVLGGLAAAPIKGCGYRLTTSNATRDGVLPLAPGVFSARKERFSAQFRELAVRSLLGDFKLGLTGDANAFIMRDERYNGRTLEFPQFALTTRNALVPRGRTARWQVTLQFTPDTQRLVRSLPPATTGPDAALVAVAEARVPTDEEVLIIPKPQSFQSRNEDFELNERTRLVVANLADAQRVEIRDLRHELRNLWGLDLALVALTEVPDLTNCIVIGEPGAHARLQVLCAQDGCDPKGLPSTEAYSVSVRPSYAVVAGAERRGTLYGVMTLRQMLKTKASGVVALRGALIRDYPDFSFRGVHLHADDHTLEWATLLIERVLARHKINFIVLECEYARWDTCAESAPPWAMTKDHMRRLKAKAAEYGIEIVPMIRLLGHCQWMFNNGRNLELAEDPVSRHTYCPSEPRSYEFIGRVLSEAVELFQPRYLHVGHDELHTRGTFPADQRCVGQTPAALFMADSLRLRRLCEERGVKMMMWGDMLLRPSEANDAAHGGPPWNVAASRPALPKDVVIADWHYAPARDYPSVRTFRALGHPVIAATWHNRANIFYFAQAARQAGALGLLQTTWTGHNGNRTALAKFPQQIAAYVTAAEYSWSPGQPHIDQLNYQPIEVLYESLFPHPALRQRQAGFLVDLAPWANVSCAEQEREGGWLGYGRGYDLRRFERGQQRLGNALALVPSSEVWSAGVMLRGSLTQREFPEAVEIAIRQRATQLQFLHTCAFAVSEDTKVAEYEIIYADGQRISVPIIYGDALRAWDDPYSGMSRHAVWKGKTLSGYPIAVKRLLWDNPRPNVALAAIRFRSAGTDASPVLLGLTGVQ